MAKGIYVLVISVNSNILVSVGALGKVGFKKGLYAYVGSAQNSLDKRVRRHLRKDKRKFWHIDHLLSNKSVAITKVFYKEAQKPEECWISRKLSQRGLPVANFGCSDCSCVSHLFMVDDCGFLRELMTEMQLQIGWRLV
jgi:Uri superfamily endonuclease